MDATLASAISGGAGSGTSSVNMQYRCLCGGPLIDHGDPGTAPLVWAGRRSVRAGPSRSSASSARRPGSSFAASDSRRNACSWRLDSEAKRSASVGRFLAERYTCAGVNPF
jgi:hypothetical protein